MPHGKRAFAHKSGQEWTFHRRHGRATSGVALGSMTQEFGDKELGTRSSGQSSGQGVRDRVREFGSSGEFGGTHLPGRHGEQLRSDERSLHGVLSREPAGAVVFSGGPVPQEENAVASRRGRLRGLSSGAAGEGAGPTRAAGDVAVCGAPLPQHARASVRLGGRTSLRPRSPRPHRTRVREVDGRMLA